jgi:predicted metal-dependent phosphoesterase TrpH
MIRADLHIHSAISDGSQSIGEILDAAARVRLTHIALTDHDTAAGFSIARALGEKRGIRVIPGVEFSAYDYTHGVRAHILGYGMRDFEPIEALGGPLLAKRHANSLQQINVLRELGYNISLEEVAAKAGRHIYKQHIMHVMVEKDYAESIGGETFRKLFKNGGPCDFDIEYLDARDAVRAIKEAEGLAVLAHPGQQGNYRCIPALKDAGLGGLELMHHANGRESRLRIAGAAASHGLLLTGGSDSHGLYEPDSPAVGAYLCPEETILRMKDLGIC